MNKMLKFFTLALTAIAIGAVALAQTADPSAILKEINQLRAQRSADARAAGKALDIPALNAEIKAKAVSATEAIDVDKVPAADAYAWAALFQLAERHADVCKLCEKFIASGPKPEEKFAAQMMMMSSCNAQGEAEMLMMTLAATTAPDALASQNLARQVLGMYSSTIESKKGIDAALMTIESVEKKTTYEAPEAYADRLFKATKDRMVANPNLPQKDDETIRKDLRTTGQQINDSLRFAFADRKADLHISAGRSAKAVEILDAFLASVDAASPVARQAKSAKVQLTLTGSMAPNLAFGKAHGDFPGLDAWRGKVVLVQFTAHWCGPCKASYPDVRKLYDDLHAKGLEVVLVTRFYGYYKTERDLSPDAEFGKMAEFVKEHNFAYPMVFVENDLFANYGVSGIPHMVVIDRAGKVAALQIGYSAPSFANFRKKIEDLLK